MRIVIWGSLPRESDASEICVRVRHPGSGRSEFGATYAADCSTSGPLPSSRGGTARLAAEARNGDSVPGKNRLGGAVVTAKTITPATAAADTMPPHWTTRVVHGRLGLSTVRRRIRSQLDADGALPSTRSRRARRRLLTSARSTPTSSRHSAHPCMWARYGSERDPSSSPKAK